MINECVFAQVWPPEVLIIWLTTTPDSNNRYSQPYLALPIPDSGLNARKMLQALIHIETFNHSKILRIERNCEI